MRGLPHQKSHPSLMVSEPSPLGSGTGAGNGLDCEQMDQGQGRGQGLLVLLHPHGHPLQLCFSQVVAPSLEFQGL